MMLVIDRDYRCLWISTGHQRIKEQRCQTIIWDITEEKCLTDIQREMHSTLCQHDEGILRVNFMFNGRTILITGGTGSRTRCN